MSMGMRLFHALSRRHPQRLADVAPTMAKASFNNLEPAWRVQIGQAIARMYGLAGLTQKEAAALLGHPDQSLLSKWVSGAERPQLDAIFAVKRLQRPLVQALAELADDVTVETVIRSRSEGR